MDPVTGGGGGYPDSVSSSPRSSSWDDPLPKLRLMCSYGGRIVPRPTDKSLCYLGGDTRIVVVDRSSSLSSLSAKLSRDLLGGRPFSLKYQLPNEDLDSLISVATDEDLDNMIDEHDRIAAASGPTANPSRRVRLFLFPSKPESAASSIGSLLDDSKSETWFVDALNGAIGIDGLPRGMSSTDSASVNCLLGLEENNSSKADPDPQPKLMTRQDVQSVPDSPMLDTNSSFGSASSAPSMNLPPIRVRADERQQPDPRYVNIDDHFAQMNLQSAATAAAAAAEEAPKQQTETVVKPVAVEAPVATDRAAYYQERIQVPPVAIVGNPIPDLKREIPVPEPAYRAEPGYVMQSNPATEQIHPHILQQQHMQQMQQHQQQQMQQQHQQQQQQMQQQQQQQQQFMHANPQFVQVPSYYHQVPHPTQQSQPFDQQVPMYYLPVRSNPQPPPATAVPLSKLVPKTEMPTNIYRTMAPQAPMVHMTTTNGADQGQMYNAMGYQIMHQQHPSQAAPVANYGYEYVNAVPASAAPAEPLHPQVYYSQATSPPSMEAKQNRGP